MDDDDDNGDAVDLFRSLLMKAAWNATGRQWRARRQLPAVAVAVAVVAEDARTKAVAERIDSMLMTLMMMTLLLLLNLLRRLEADGEKRRGGGISHANYSSTDAVVMDGPGPPGSPSVQQ